MNESYSALGGCFEYLNKDCGYEEWSQYLIKRLQSLGAGRQGIDIGCGNGYFTRALARAGYSVKGVDISPQMLCRAQEISAGQGIRIEFLLGDITKLKLPSKVDFAVAANDCLNYVSPAKLHAAFTHVAGCLKKGGAFLFDISSAYKLGHVIGDNLFAEDGEDFTWLWFNSFKDGRAEMDITLFKRRSDGAYIRMDEHQTQYAHTMEGVKEELFKAGFSSVRCEGHLGAELCETTQRINFICIK